MAVKKSTETKEVIKYEMVESEPVDVELEGLEEPIAPSISDEEPKKHVGDAGSFCVYIGPSIRGVIQSGTIYGKSLEETKMFLATAIEKYPLIAKLISTDRTIAEDRIKVKAAGNLLNVYYTKLASGKSN
ncbi:MAG: hypothetical protein PHX79_03195 [Sphaerochaetaceae bacterium]|nr:hypothetical protein [Sphaerochaetaceae bacterium]